MNYQEKVADYCTNIDTLSQAVIQADVDLGRGLTDTLGIKELIFDIVGEDMKVDCLRSISVLGKYYEGTRYFAGKYARDDARTQVGRLFDFRPDKFKGNIRIDTRGPVFMISFSEMQDLLYARFAKRKDQFTQEDEGTGFYKVLHFEGHSVPVCAILEGYHEQGTIIHELTHLRNDIIGMDYYSRGGGRDRYEVFVYDDLQNEILAFFSEGYKRAEVQLTILHDKRYHFYRRMEDWGDREQQRFVRDVDRFISIARAIKEIRGDIFVVDLAIIPIHQWARYLRYISKK